MDSNNKVSHPPVAPMSGPDAAPDTTTQAREIPPEIRAYLEQLLADANMFVADEKLHEDILQDLYDKLDEFIAIKVVESLPADKLAVFTQMNNEQKSKEEIEQFLKDAIPNAQEVMKNIFFEFRDIYLHPEGTDQRNSTGQDEETPLLPPKD